MNIYENIVKMSLIAFFHFNNNNNDNMINKYFIGKRLETQICMEFQKYIERKRGCKSFLKLRGEVNAHIDYLGHLYKPNFNVIVAQLAVEVRSLKKSKEDIEKEGGYIDFPITKLNELMKFWRMDKECYIVYKLAEEVYVLSWDYYLKHNFEIELKDWKGDYVKLPVRNFIECI